MQIFMCFSFFNINYKYIEMPGKRGRGVTIRKSNSPARKKVRTSRSASRSRSMNRSRSVSRSRSRQNGGRKSRKGSRKSRKN